MGTSTEAELRERITQLETLLGAKMAFPLSLGLSRSETVILGLLLARPIVNEDAAFTVLYGDRSGNPPTSNFLSSFMLCIRRKLDPHGVTVSNRPGTGYFLTPENKTALRDLIEALS